MTDKREVTPMKSIAICTLVIVVLPCNEEYCLMVKIVLWCHISNFAVFKLWLRQQFWRMMTTGTYTFQHVGANSVIIWNEHIQICLGTSKLFTKPCSQLLSRIWIELVGAQAYLIAQVYSSSDYAWAILVKIFRTAPISLFRIAVLNWISILSQTTELLGI